MVRAVLNLVERWSLSDPEVQALLGDVKEGQLRDWQEGAVGEIPDGLALRLADLLGIHASLCALFKDESIYQWVKRRNEVFGGKSALPLMLLGGGPEIRRVREYLDAERYG
jgi:hypothetical protein